MTGTKTGEGEADVDETEAPPSKVRYALRSACAWTVIAELFRRYQGARDLRVHQYYPGMSPHGAIMVTEGPTFVEGSADRGRFDFTVASHGGAIEFRGRTVGNALAPLHEGRFEDVAGALAAVAGWPAAPKQATTAPVLVARAMARFLARQAVSDRPFRSSSGYLDHSSNGTAEGCGWLLPLREASAVKGMKDHDAMNFATRFWMIHRGEEGPAYTAWSPAMGPALVLDFATARGVLHLEGGLQRVDLMERFATHERSLRAVVDLMERLLGVQ